MIDTLTRWPTPTGCTWRPATTADGPALADLRADVLRASLERLGRYDGIRVREFFLRAYVPGNTWVLTDAVAVLGSIALRPEEEATWVEHFYLAAAVQGGGLGTALLQEVLASADATGTRLRLDVLQGSPARRLYERHGFVLDHEDSVDVWLRRDPHPADPH